MNKDALKVTSKVLTGLVLLTGVTSVPANAVEVKNAAVDVNAKEVKVSVYEKDGHYYAKLVSDKEVSNVVARIVVDGKSEFTVKRDLIKAGEVVELELDINRPNETVKKLPNTTVKKQSIKTTTTVNGHKFEITVKYDVDTEEVTARQEDNKEIKDKLEDAAKETEAKKEEARKAEENKKAEEAKRAEEEAAAAAAAAAANAAANTTTRSVAEVPATQVVPAPAANVAPTAPTTNTQAPTAPVASTAKKATGTTGFRSAGTATQKTNIAKAATTTQKTNVVNTAVTAQKTNVTNTAVAAQKSVAKANTATSKQATGTTGFRSAGTATQKTNVAKAATTSNQATTKAVAAAVAKKQAAASTKTAATKNQATTKAVATAVAKKQAAAATPVATTATKSAAKVAEKQASVAKATSVQKQAATTAKKQTTTVSTPTSGSREEQIRLAYLAKVNKLRAMNNLAPLSQNTALNASTKYRSSEVLRLPIDGNIHGAKGSRERSAAARAGYSTPNKILYNVAVSNNNGTPDQVAQRLLDILYKEINNVVKAYPYGHRNTLLSKSASEVGVGVTISNGVVSVVQHQNHSGSFQGVTPIPSVYIDGKRY